MEKIIRNLIDQKLLINLLAVLIVLAGIFAVSRINRESIPDVPLDMVTVVTVYPGASPSDAEELVSVPIEKKLRSVSGLQKVRSYNVENVSVIVIYLADNTKKKTKVVQDVKDAVEQVSGLPSIARKPLVSEVTFDNTELVSIAFTGKTTDVPYSRLREFAKQSEGFFYDLDGIANVEKFGYYDREYLVEVNPASLDRQHVGLNTLVNVLRMRNVDFPGGALRIGRNEFVLRTTGKFKNAEEIRNTVIRGNDAGFSLRVRDLATVRDTYEEADVHHRFNGKEAVVFKLWKKRSADEIELSTRLRRAVSSYSVPGYSDVDISFFDDRSETTRHRITSVVEEAAVGFVILGIFMLLLLGRRMSFLVLSGIPLTFMATFTAMWWMGITINIVSLFGMIMVLGMMVDFSIVIAENSHRYMEHGLKRRPAVEKGVSEVFWSVTVTLISIVAAFVPLLLVSGIIGKFVRPIPLVIISTLIASWVIAMFVMPMYLNMFLGESHVKKGKVIGLTVPQKVFLRLFGERARDWIASVPGAGDEFEEGIFGRFQKAYEALARRALHHRYATVGVLLILLMLSLFLAGKIGFKFMPGGGEEHLRARVKLPFETNLDANLAEMDSLEQIIRQSVHPDEVRATHLRAGEDHTDILDPKPAKATYKSTFDVYLVPENNRRRSCREINRSLRERIETAKKDKALTDDIGVKLECVFMGPPVGRPVNIEIQGEDFAVMQKIGAEYSEYLATLKGLSDITTDLEDGKTEYRYTIDEAMAARTGISAYDIATAINTSFAGSVATVVSQKEEQVGVRVRFEETSRRKFSGLHEVKLTNMIGGLMPGMVGGLIPLDAVSHVQTAKGYSQINRLNYRRLVQVQADVDTSTITPVEVTSLLSKKFKDVEARYPGYRVRYGGEQEDTDRSLGELGILFAAALIFIFVVLTIFTRSLIMPGVIMVAIPFALVGVILALFTHGQPLSFMSVLGLFSLAGIIVSNTLVLVQFINKFRDEGLSLEEALLAGGVVRLRPIILTAGSMVLELMPVIYGVGGKDYLVSPLAMAFGYGLIAATFITLILIPCFYYIAEDAMGAISRFLSRFGVHIHPAIYHSGSILSSAEGNRSTGGHHR